MVGVVIPETGFPSQNGVVYAGYVAADHQDENRCTVGSLAERNRKSVEFTFPCQASSEICIFLAGEGIEACVGISTANTKVLCIP